MSLFVGFVFFFSFAKIVKHSENSKNIEKIVKHSEKERKIAKRVSTPSCLTPPMTITLGEYIPVHQKNGLISQILQLSLKKPMMKD